MHYNAEFRIIPYKLVACGIILKFAHTCHEPVKYEKFDKDFYYTNQTITSL